MKTNSKKELFEALPVPKALRILALPTIISQLINLVYNMVDAVFIGRTGNSNMVAATTLSLTIMLMTIAFSNLFGIGGGSLIARLIGKHQDGEARKVSSFSLYCTGITAVIYSLLIGLFLTPILNFLGASQFTLEYARQYTFFVIVLGCLPSMLSAACSHLLRNVGYAKQASIGLSGGGILNIILDPLFMFVILPEGYEVAGAALATLISNVFSCVYLLTAVYKVSKKAPLSLNIKDATSISKQSTKELFKVGVPSAILTGLFDIANIFLNKLAASHSDTVLAGMGIVMKVERIPTAINIGLCQAMMPLVAYNYASGNRERMKKAIDTARIYGLVISAVSIVLFLTLASHISKLFLSTAAKSPENALLTLGYATVFLRLRCLASPVQFLNFHSSFCMQAMGDGKGTMMHAVVRELVFYIPFMYILNYFFGENGLAVSLAVGEFFSAIFALILLYRFINTAKRKKAQSNS